MFPCTYKKITLLKHLSENFPNRHFLGISYGKKREIGGGNNTIKRYLLPSFGRKLELISWEGQGVKFPPTSIPQPAPTLNIYEDDTDFASCPMHLLLYGGLMMMIIIKRGLLNLNGKTQLSFRLTSVFVNLTKNCHKIVKNQSMSKEKNDNIETARLFGFQKVIFFSRKIC